MSSQSSENKTSLLNSPRLFLGAFLLLAVLLGLMSIFKAGFVGAETQPPAVINYQGKVLENDVSVTTTKEMGFVLFDSKTGGSRLYTASGTLPSNTGTIDVSPTQGIFNVELGSGNTNSLDPSIFRDNEVIYLQVYIEGNKLTPRKRMTSQPFAMNAQYLMGHSATTTPTSTQYVPVSQTDGDFLFQGMTVSSSEDAASSALKITNNNNTQFNFLSGGKLGINSSSPSANLTVVGDLNVTATSTWGQVQVTGTEISALDSSGLSLFDQNSNGIFIQDGGNIGIGTTTPTSTLDVAGTSTLQSNLFVGNDSEQITTSTFNLNGDDSYIEDQLGVGNEIFAENALHVGTSSLHLTGDVSGGKIRMDQGPLSIESQGGKLGLNTSSNKNIITGSGNFGINTSSPAKQFSVNGASTLSGTSTLAGSLYVNEKNGRVGINTSSPAKKLSVSGKAKITGTSTIADTLNVDKGNGGRVGINTTSPAKTLSVNGSARVTGTSTLSTSTFKGEVFDLFDLKGKIGNPEAKGSITNSSASLDSPRSVHISGNYAYVASSVDDTLQILDISDPSNPTAVGSITNSAANTLLDDPEAVAVSGNYAYLLSTNSHSLQIIDVSNPHNPTALGNIDNPESNLNSPISIDISGNYAYIASEFGGGSVQVIDISSPWNPIEVGNIDDNGNIALGTSKSIRASGKYAYVASNGDNGLQILDISDPANPTSTGKITNSAANTKLDEPSSVYISNNFAYVTAKTDNSLQIIDISDPTNPTAAGNITNASAHLNTPKSIQVSGDQAYIASASGALQIIDVSSSTNPTAVGNITSSSAKLDGARSVFTSGNYAYVSSVQDNAVQVIDVSGAKVSNADIGSLRTNNLSVQDSTQFERSVDISGGLSVGSSGFMVSGDFAMSNSTSSLSATNTLNFDSTALFKSSVSTSDPDAFVFNTTNDLDKSNSVFTIRDNNTDFLDVTGSGTTTIYNDLVVATTTPGLTTSSFKMDGDDAYIEDQLGVGNEIFAENALHVGTSSLHLTGDVSGGKIRMDQGPLSIESQGGKLGLNTSSNKNIITGSGNFGINTSSPSKQLSVSGESALTGTSTIANTLSVDKGNGGKVGINSTSPSKTLTVNGTSEFGSTSTFSGPTKFNSSNLFKGKINNPTQLSTFENADMNEPVDIDVSGDYAYFLASSSDNLVVTDISDPSNPSFVDEIGAAISDFSNPQEVVVRNNYAYVAVNDGSKHLQVIDISNPSNLKAAGSYGTNKAATDITIKGNYAYLVEPDGNLVEIIDISDPANIDDIGSEPNSDVVGDIGNGTTPKEISISKNYAYIAFTGSDEFKVSDISDPKNSISISKTGITLNNPIEMEVEGKHAYIATGQKLKILDVSDPNNVTSVKTKDLSVDLEDIYVSGRYIYLAEKDANIEIFDAGTDPSSLDQVSKTSISDTRNQALSVHVSGNYGFVGGFDSGGASTLFTMDMRGAEISNAEIGNTEISNLEVMQLADFKDSVEVNGGLSVGSNGLMLSGGDFAMGHATSSLTATSSLRFNDTALFESSVSSSDANSFVFDTHYDINDSNNIFSIKDNGTPRFKLDGRGRVAIASSSADYTPEATIHVDGSICVTDNKDCDSALLDDGEIAAENTSVQQADLAEIYSSKQNLQSGELVKLADNSNTTTVKRTSKAYDEDLIGIVSTNPGVLMGSSASGTYPIALSGRVPTKVNDSGGDIHVGDPITASPSPGVGMKADHSSQIVGFALESFTGSGTTTISIYVSPEYRYDENEFKVADNGNIGFGTTSPESKLDVEGTAQADLFKSSSSTAMSDLAGGLTVGPKGFVLEGGFTMNSANPSVSSTNNLSFDSTTLFETSVTSSDDYAYIFDTTNQLGVNSSTYLMSIRNNDQPQLSVAANGDVHAGGTLFADGLNTNENDPGDLAEEVEIKSGQNVEPGEVLVVDSDQIDTYKRSQAPYSSAVAGVVSTDPSITIGGTESENSAVMAMVGRVPTKVTNENGSVKRGDLLVSASKPGYAMKYDPSQEIDNNTISSVGIALESFDGESSSSSGKVMTLVKPGWISNYNQSINEVKKNITKVAQAKGVNVNGKPSELTVESSDSGDIEYKEHGNLDLGGNNIVNVSGIRGTDNKWSIDTNGRFVTNVDTSDGEKSLYTVQSDDEAYYTFFGTDSLKGGEKEVNFEDFRQDIIDEDYPIQVNVTLKSPANGIYVNESSEAGFTVKETGDGESNAKFDWTVIAQRETSESDKSVQPHGGCTNPRATNYDPTATEDDGSCKIVGCVDSKAVNYDSTATIGGRIDCVYKEKKVVKGCTAKRSDNYDPEANMNDGSCEFENQNNNEQQQDNEPPQLDLLGAKEVKLEVGDDYNDPGVELSDNRDNSPKLTKKVDGEKVESLNIDTTEPGSFEVVYHAQDDAGNENEIKRNIIVEEAEEDNGEDPQLSLKGKKKITLTTDQKYVEPGAEATDEEDGDISDQTEKLGSINDDVAGEYSLVYQIKDSDDNKASVTRVVTIEAVTSSDKNTDSDTTSTTKQESTTSTQKESTSESDTSSENQTNTSTTESSQDSDTDTNTTTTQQTTTTTDKNSEEQTEEQQDSETEEATQTEEDTDTNSETDNEKQSETDESSSTQQDEQQSETDDGSGSQQDQQQDEEEQTDTDTTSSDSTTDTSTSTPE